MNIKNVKRPATFIKRVERDMQENSSEWCNGNNTGQKRVLGNLKSLALREEPKGENRDEILQVMKQIIKLYESPYEGRIDSKVNRKEGQIDVKKEIQIKQLNDTQRNRLAITLGLSTDDEKLKAIEIAFGKIARKQKIMDSLKLPNKTELTKDFKSIKNKLKKIGDDYSELPFELRCLLNIHLHDTSSGFKNSFENEIDELLQAINTYIESTSTHDNLSPQGQYADSIVPIAKTVKTLFPEISIKRFKTSKFHKIVCFYFEEYLNVYRADFEYIIKQALSN